MRETAGRLLQREDHPAVDTTQEDHTEGQRGQLRDRKGPPDGGDAAAEGQEERRGQEDQELTDNRAGTPMASMSADASNKPRISAGKS